MIHFEKLRKLEKDLGYPPGGFERVYSEDSAGMNVEMVLVPPEMLQELLERRGMELFSDSMLKNLTSLSRLISWRNSKKGWWDEELKHPAIKINRVVAEAMELVEEYARGTEADPSDKVPEITRAEEEAADIIIRVLDFAGGNRLKIGEAISRKLEYNQTRSHRHGGKKF